MSTHVFLLPLEVSYFRNKIRLELMSTFVLGATIQLAYTNIHFLYKPHSHPCNFHTYLVLQLVLGLGSLVLKGKQKTVSFFGNS